MEALVANTHSHSYTRTRTLTHTNIGIIEPATLTPRKRRPSKSADGGAQQPNEQALLWGEGFGVAEVVEALRGKVEVEKVVGRLLVWRREGGIKAAGVVEVGSGDGGEGEVEKGDGEGGKSGKREEGKGDEGEAGKGEQREGGEEGIEEDAVGAK